MKTIKPALLIVGTPIGNLGDISERAIDTLRSVDIILAEDTRHTLKLCNHYGIRAKLVSCHRFNEASRVRGIIEQARGGTSMALVTNAGMPCISDPGNRIIAAFHENGIPVTVVPGPSSVTAAVALSGFAGDRFLFEGFLSRKNGARKKRFAEISALPFPVVFFESPYRCIRILEEMSPIFGKRIVFLARELTKLNEEYIFGTAEELKDILIQRGTPDACRPVKGELVFVLAPASKEEIKAKSGCSPNIDGEESQQ